MLHDSWQVPWRAASLVSVCQGAGFSAKRSKQKMPPKLGGAHRSGACAGNVRTE